MIFLEASESEINARLQVSKFPIFELFSSLKIILEGKLTKFPLIFYFIFIIPNDTSENFEFFRSLACFIQQSNLKSCHFLRLFVPFLALSQDSKFYFFYRKSIYNFLQMACLRQTIGKRSLGKVKDCPVTIHGSFFSSFIAHPLRALTFMCPSKKTREFK